MKVGFRWYDSIFIVLIAYLLVLQILAIWPFTVDDMFISLRYAKNWASGEGLLWNSNFPPVEGYSNFSFVVLGALALIFKANPVIILKMAGFLGLMSLCVFIYLISRFWFNTREALLPCIALLFYKGQIIWAVSGLETTVYQSCVCASVYFVFKGLGYSPYTGDDVLKLKNQWSLILAGLFLSLAGMTRPEAPALMLLFFMLLAWDNYSNGLKKIFKDSVYFAAPIALLYIPYFLWRWHYYGFLFPNSVYCKGFVHESYALDINFLKLIWPFALLSIPAMIQAQDKRHYFLWVPSLLYFVLLLHADPIVAFDNRLFLPAFVLLLPLSLEGLSSLNLLIFKKKDAFFYAAFYLSAFLILIVFMPKMTLAQYRYFSEAPVQGELLRMQVLRWLDSHAKDHDKVVLADAGLVPFYSPLPFIDSYCLNNLAMGHYAASERYEQFCQEVVKDKPSIIILTALNEGGQLSYTPTDLCLKKILNKQSGYKKIKIFSTDKKGTGYRYELFRHKLMS